MSTFHYQARILNKSKHSAIASASYKSGEKLFSERDGEYRNYREREVKPDCFILAPENAPEWAYDREKLWNKAESAERSYNGQIARDIVIALPIEISEEQQKELIMKHVQDNFVSQGMIADVAIHRDKEENPHAHVQLTMRPLNDKGEFGKKKYRDYLYNEDGTKLLDKHGKHAFVAKFTTDWNEKETLEKWRRNYAEIVNDYYKKNELDIKVSEKSFVEQGLEKEAKHRLSREEYYVEKKAREEAGIKGEVYKPVTYYGKINELIDQKNERIEAINEELENLNVERKGRNNVITINFEDVRNNYSYSYEEQKMINKIEKRLGKEVSYSTTKDNLKKLENWKRSLDKKRSNLNAEKSVLVSARDAYKTKPKSVLIFGFKPDEFEKTFSNRLAKYNEESTKFNESYKSYVAVYKESKEIHELQKDILQKEFNALYPGYNNFKSESDKLYDLKDELVTDYRNTGVVKDNIEQIKTNPDIYSDKYAEAKNVYDEFMNTKRSLLILERTLNKRESTFKESFKDYKPEELYNSSITRTSLKEQIKSHEDKLKENESKVDNVMMKIYEDIDAYKVKKLPNDIKIELINRYTKGESTNDVKQDLKELKSDIRQEEFNKGRFKDIDDLLLSPKAQEASDIIDSFLAFGQQNNNNEYEEEQRKRKRKQKKLYREFGDLEK